MDAGSSSASRTWDTVAPASLERTEHGVRLEVPLFEDVDLAGSPRNFAVEVAAADTNGDTGPPRLVVSVRKRQEIAHSEAHDTGTEQLHAEGATVTGNVEDAAVEPPAVALGSGGTASSGGSRVSGLIQDLGGGSIPVLYWIGGLVMAGGIAVVLIARDLRSGLVVMSGGAVIVGLGAVLDEYPWVTLVAVGLGLAGAVCYVWQRRQEVKATKAAAEAAAEAARQEQALHATVRAVESVSPEVGKQVKEQIKAAAGAAHEEVKDTITEVKRAEGL